MYIKASPEKGLVRLPYPRCRGWQNGRECAGPLRKYLDRGDFRKKRMDKKTVYSKTGKGVLEIKNKAGKLPKDLVRVLTLIDGKSSVADLITKSKLGDPEINKALSDLTIGGCNKENATNHPPGGAARERGT